MEKTNLKTVAGDTEKYLINLVDANDTAVSLVGATIKMTIRKKDGTQVWQKVVTSHQDAPGGISEISIPAGDTENLEATVYNYDIQVELSGGDRKTLFMGDFNVAKGVTND